MRIEGDKELIKALRAFPEKLSKRVLRSAAGKATTVVAKAARLQVKPISPTIAKHIGTRVKLYKGGNVFAIAGPKRDTPISATGHRPSKTAHLVDRGTKPHGLKAWGKVQIIHPGARAHPFLEPAEKQSSAEVKRIYITALREGIAKITKE